MKSSRHEYDLSGASWHKSSHSDASGGNCLEAARTPTGIVPVRDSKIPAGPVLTFPAVSWAAFISQVKAEHAA
ncbi:DUF397 domain-containing protein [Streptomyces sp. NPDC057617]|uniref:DUF397 domain-containing protein n=1 Tax=Streptomyces sp. NPDC057617 TaxID=3346184 RepID=UPI0036A514A7